MVVYPHPADRVWAALTSSEALAAWFMPNDFEPAVGHRFTFQAKPADPRPAAACLPGRAGGHERRARSRALRRGLARLPGHLPSLGKVPGVTASDVTASVRSNHVALTNLEVISVPVSDQERAKQFYVGKLGFTVQIDAGFGEAMRWVMLRPPGSGTCITLVTWFETMPAGSLNGSVLGCDNLEKTLDDLASQGVAFHEDEIQSAPWGRWKTFSDPDGNGWILQQSNPDFGG
jgi:catechol 2,3-dioxygenase-like lactoylglutathione lyase family enzyme